MFDIDTYLEFNLEVFADALLKLLDGDSIDDICSDGRFTSSLIERCVAKLYGGFIHHKRDTKGYDIYIDGYLYSVKQKTKNTNLQFQLSKYKGWQRKATQKDVQESVEFVAGHFIPDITKFPIIRVIPIVNGQMESLVKKVVSNVITSSGLNTSKLYELFGPKDGVFTRVELPFIKKKDIVRDVEAMRHFNVLPFAIEEESELDFNNSLVA